MSAESIPTTLDPARTEAFGQRVLDAINGGAVALMLSIGHRTGLFDVMSTMPPATSAEIAGEAGLDERYVREWLGAMVTGRIVDFDPTSRRYRLPAEHAASLTRSARPGNMAVTCQWIPLLGAVEDEIVECFERGGGVPYAAYDRFHAVMAEESDQTIVAVLVDSIVPIVPGLVATLEAGIDVLDVGCGSGRALNRLASAFPRSRFVGYDLSEEAVETGRRQARELGLGNVRFDAHDVAAVDDVDRFDLITAFDAIHDQAHPDRVLAGIARALRPDGVFLVQEIAGSSHVDRDVENPVAPFLYTISCMHCMTVSLAQGGAGLGAMWGSETATRMLREAGFEEVELHQLPHDILNHYYVARKEPASPRASGGSASTADRAWRGGGRS
jgi:2-polyprenyl-3-methyl-5-hydroxy-6-metoxy-1,4-benzoquinol methylase